MRAERGGCFHHHHAQENAASGGLKPGAVKTPLLIKSGSPLVSEKEKSRSGRAGAQSVFSCSLSSPPSPLEASWTLAKRFQFPISLPSFSHTPFDPFVRVKATLAYFLKPPRTNVFRETKIPLPLPTSCCVSLFAWPQSLLLLTEWTSKWDSRCPVQDREKVDEWGCKEEVKQTERC